MLVAKIVAAGCGYVWMMFAYRVAMAWWDAATETEADAQLRRWQREERAFRGW